MLSESTSEPLRVFRIVRLRSLYMFVEFKMAVGRHVALIGVCFGIIDVIYRTRQSLAQSCRLTPAYTLVFTTRSLICYRTITTDGIIIYSLGALCGNYIYRDRVVHSMADAGMRSVSLKCKYKVVNKKSGMLKIASC